MRRTPTPTWRLGAVLALSGMTLAGCDSLPFFSSNKGKSSTKTASATQPAQTEAEKLSAQAQLQAQRLKQAMAANGTGDAGDGMPQVQWIDLHAPARRGAQRSTVRGNTPASIADASAGAAPRAGTPIHKTLEAKAAPDSDQAQRHLLISRLLDAIRAGGQPVLAKAVALTGLTLVEPGGNLDPGALPGLTDAQRQEVGRFFALVGSLSSQLIKDGRMPSGDALASQLDNLDGSQPVRVRLVRLCRRVSGYGVYDTFDSNTFVAGREQPIIIYVELDQFRSVKGTDDLYHVKLAQEVTLYNEADGLAVWHQPSVDIVDDSHNRRHDFFLVQLVKLPANLSVGKYRLNVRVTDTADSSLDELKVPIQVVADQSLVSSSNPAR